MPWSLNFEGSRNVEIKFQDLVGIKTAPGPGSPDPLIALMRTSVDPWLQDGSQTMITFLLFYFIILLLKLPLEKMYEKEKSFIWSLIFQRHIWSNNSSTTIWIVCNDSLKMCHFGHKDVGDNLSLTSGCWCHQLGDIFWSPKLVFKDRGSCWQKRPKSSPTSQSCRQHIS